MMLFECPGIYHMRCGKVAHLVKVVEDANGNTLLLGHWDDAAGRLIPATWNPNGTVISEHFAHENDLSPPILGMFLNVYPNYADNTCFHTREAADAAGGSERIACVYVVCSKGEGLDQ